MPKKRKNSSSKFGGSNLRGNARSKRPLDPKRPLHLVLKSSLCRGRFSLLNPRYAKRVQATFYFYARKFGLKIYRYQNVGNHIHLVIYGVTARSYAAFVRSVSGRIAQALLKEMGQDSLGGNRHRMHQATTKFWDYRPFSRAVTWGRDFSGIKNYILKNLLDALGLDRTNENLHALKNSIRSSADRARPPSTATVQLSFA